MAPVPALADYLAKRATPETGAVILALSAAAAVIATRIAGFGSDATLEAAADAAFAAKLAPLGIRFLASSPQDAIAEVNPNGSLALALDPLRIQQIFGPSS